MASHTAEETYANERVPSGFEFWSVRVHVTQLETVFLYRFLQELLGYISLTLALRPPPLQSRAGTALTDRATAAASAAMQAELQRGMGTVLQLDVSMEAPVIIMPRNSDSPDKVRGTSVPLPAQQNNQLLCRGLSRASCGFWRTHATHTHRKPSVEPASRYGRLPEFKG